MSARRIKIKARRKAPKQAASAHNSPITTSEIFGSPAAGLDEDYLDSPFPELDPACRAEQPYLPDVDVHALTEKVRRNPEIAKASRRFGAPAGDPAEGLDAKGLSHLYNTDLLKTASLKTAGPANTSTPIPSAAPASSAASAATAPATAPIQPAPGQSTGPRSLEGKARSSHNAIKHGLTRPAGSMRFLRGEDSSGHDRLILQFNEQFVPMTGAERECIREIVDSLWLARRARNLQTDVLDDARADLHHLALYLRYETAHQRAHNAAIKTLLALQKDRRLRNQNHEKWEEPVIWGVLEHVVLDDPPPEMGSGFPAAATTSASPAGSDSSFRSAAFKPWSENATTCGAPPNAHQAASSNTIEEVKPAA